MKFLQELYYLILIRSYSLYQPVYMKGKLIKTRDRNCLDRWEMIKKEITALPAKSVVDLGCAEGFYVIQAARELDCFSLGIDADIRSLNVARSQLALEKITNASFSQSVIDEHLLDKLPRFDLVIFMSVMHHMMYKNGENYCRLILQKLRPKIGKAMIFEMGQSDEHMHEWSRKLPDMGPNPHEWIKRFLLSCGFSNAEKIGESDSFRSGRRRAIFRVKP